MNGYVTYDSISKGIFEAALEKISKHQRAIMDKILAAALQHRCTVRHWLFWKRPAVSFSISPLPDNSENTKKARQFLARFTDRCYAELIQYGYKSPPSCVILNSYDFLDGVEVVVEEWKRVDRMRTEIQNLISALECCPPGNQVWMSVVTAQWASSGLLLANKLEA